MNGRIILTLPGIEPGQYPPEKCPCCGAGSERYELNDQPGRIMVDYDCGAGYDLDYNRWYTNGVCSKDPLPAAIQRAFLESLTWEQHSRVALSVPNGHPLSNKGDEYDVEQCIEAVIDALEEESTK